MNKAIENDPTQKRTLPLSMGEKDTAILIIDVQNKLIEVVKGKDMILFNIKRLIEASDILNIVKFITEQNPDKLGNTHDLIRDSKQPIAYSKMSFSCVGCDPLMSSLRKNKIRNILLCGIETHVCVQQTALDLIGNGFNIFVASDAVGSRHTIDHKTALRRLESSGAIISTVESVIFEWCKSADRSEFKKISEIIRKSK